MDTHARFRFGWLASVATVVCAALGVAPADGAAATASSRGLPHDADTRLVSSRAGISALGWSAATSGSTTVVGAPFTAAGGVPDVGAVEVFRAPSGAPSVTHQVAFLSITAAQADLFGYSVATSGDVIAVGAPLATAAGKNGAGAVYVYVRPPRGWGSAKVLPSATIISPAPAANAEFGLSIAMDDDSTLVVGDLSQGAVRVYSMPPGGWGQAVGTPASLTATSSGVGLGYSVAIDGDLIVAGSPLYQNGSYGGAGAAYVYVEPDSGGWVSTTESRLLTESNPVNGARLGTAGIAMYGQYIAVAATGISTGGGPVSRVDLFKAPPGGWAGATPLMQTAQITDPVPTQQFGDSLALTSNSLVVGAPLASDDGVEQSGMVDVFNEPAAGWTNTSTPTTRFIAASTHDFDHFGQAVTMLGSRLAVGAPDATPDGDLNAAAGQVDLFTPMQPPTLSKVAQSHRSWSRGSRLPALNPAKIPSGGTEFRFTVNEAATVQLGFERHRTHGYGGPTTLTVAAVKGANRLAFDGVLTAHHKLSVGHYRVIIRATNAAGDSSKTHTERFTVTKGGK
jgi:FG-GAP repeat